MELTMFYNGPSTYQDIYEIALGDIVSLNFMYYDLTNDTFVTGLTTTCIYSNINVNVDGYYERMYVATDGFFYQLTFRIVIKVGNPLGDPTIPQSHLRYHYQEGWKDQLSTYGNVLYINGVEQSEIILQTFTYDSQGNPTTISNFQYDGTTYDYAQLSYDGRELKSISVFNQSSVVPVVMITYTYNDQGYRTQKKIDWMTQGSQIIDYYLTGQQVLYETDGTYGMIYTYDYDGTLISFTYDNNTQDSIDGITYYYLRNQQGDIIKIIDEDGSILVTYTYDAWGKMIGTVDLSMNDLASINPYRYRGYRYDEEIEWYYLNSRYYDGNLGRFINADGLLGEVGNPLGHNMYAYCVNNPVMYSDITGNLPQWMKWTIGAGIIVGLGVIALTIGGTIVVGALIGASVGAGVGLISGVSLDENGLSYDFERAATGFMLGSITGAISGAIGAKFGLLSKSMTFTQRSIMAGVDGTLSLSAYFGKAAIHGDKVSLGGALIASASGLFRFADPTGNKVFDALWGPMMGAELAWGYDLLSSLDRNQYVTTRYLKHYN